MAVRLFIFPYLCADILHSGKRIVKTAFHTGCRKSAHIKISRQFSLNIRYFLCYRIKV